MITAATSRPNTSRFGFFPATDRVVRLALVVALLGLNSAGCATSTRSDGEASDGPDAGVELTVQNRHWRDVVVFVTRGGARTRLGMVTSNSSSDFGLTRDFLAGGYTVTLLVEVVGSDEALRSGPVTVSGGDIVVWRLRPVLNQSNVSVRPGDEGAGGPSGGVYPYTGTEGVRLSSDRFET